MAFVLPTVFVIWMNIVDGKCLCCYQSGLIDLAAICGDSLFSSILFERIN